MESQRNGASQGHIRRLGLSGWHRPDRSFITWMIWLMCSVALWAGVAQAQSTSYVYDANGRVVAVTTNNANSVQYGYDTLGHVSQISAPLATSQMAIFAFMPTHGEAGTQVTIQGQGFDSNVANDTVSFNGTAATVLSATATQLVATVPSGATTGPITVTADGQSATSATAFIVDDTGIPPTITQVSPLLVPVGGTVTVTGTHLDPVAGATTVLMGGQDVGTPAAISDVQLQYAVPSAGTTGLVTVATPYGTATSTTPVTVLPSGVSAASVVSSGNATVNGAGVSLNIGASGQYGAVTFVAPPSGWVSLQATGLTTTASSITYTVYASGNGVLAQGTISSASPSIHLPHLTAGTTYLVLIQPSGGGAQVTLTVQTNALLATNVAATVITTTPGQSQRVLFNATAGQNLAFVINSATTNPAGSTVTYTVYNPNGGSYASATANGSGIVNLGNMPTTGTYQVILAPGSGVTATMQVEVEPGMVVTPGVAPQAYAASMANQNIYMSFNATQGENLELALNNVNAAGASSNQFIVYVYNPAGVQVASFTCYASNPGKSCNQHLWYLAAGQYQAVATPNDGGVISFTALLQDDLVAPTMAPNSTQSVSLAAGQVERYTFNANVGDTVALDVSGVTTTPTGQTVTFSVYSPSQGAITTGTTPYTTFAPTSSQTVNLPNLPASGTYTVIVSPNYGLPATAQLSFGAGVATTMTANSAAQSYTANVSGQNVYMPFVATQGENLELTLTNVAVTGASGNGFQVFVYNAAGSQVTYFWCYPTNAGASCSMHLWDLPAGQYTAVATPNYGGEINFKALLLDDLVGPTITANSTQSVSLAAGQVERYTFNANAGDTVALDVSGLATTPTGQTVTFSVYSPSQGAISTLTTPYTTFSSTSSQTVNLPNLPVSGTYTVIVSPNYGLPATGQLSLAAGVDTTLTANSAAQSYTANVPGQNVYMPFAATTGENLELTLTNVTVTGASNNGFQVYVYNAAGSQVTEFWCYPTNPGASCSTHLWYLPAGQYSAVATPNYGGVISFNALLQDDLVGPTIADGSVANIALGAGQVERYTFNANAGDTVALDVSGVTTTPTGQTVTFSVYSPSQGAISTGTTPYTTFAPTSSQTVNLPNLPVSGTYTVIVSPNDGLPATAQLGVMGAIGGALAYGGVPGGAQDYATTVPGQNIYLSFTANQGDNLELTLNQLAISGSSATSFNVTVYNAANTQVATFSCSPSSPGASCMQHLWDMAAGTYSVIAVPPSGGTIAFDALLYQDIIGQTLTAGNQSAAYLNWGQVERMSFIANAGDTVQLQATWNAAGVAGVKYLVYRPDVGTITTSTPVFASYESVYGSNQSPYITLNTPVSGTYTVIVAPDYGDQESVELGDVSQTLTNPPNYTTPTLANNGTAQNESASAAGQSVTMSFNANAGDNQELTFSNINVVGASTNGFQVNVTDPNGKAVVSYDCYASNIGGDCRYALWNLIAGTYSVNVAPYWGGTLNFTAALNLDIAGPALTTTPTAVNLALGQVERLTFNANVGDSVTLNLSGVSTTPAGQAVYVEVYRPDIGAITPTSEYTTAYTSSSSVINLANLPASGTYTVVAYTLNGEPGSVQMSLVPETTATLTTGAAAQNFSANSTGQNVYLNFTANQGDNLELTFNNVNVPGASYNGFEVYIYNAQGTEISYQDCYASNPGAACRIPLWNLPAGTYSVVASPYWGGTINFTAQLQADETGATLTANAPATIDLAQGQVQRLTFNATVGETVALNLSGVASTAPTGQAMYVSVYRPDTGAITTGNYYTQFNATSSQVVNLSNLPASGTYTVVVYTTDATPASAQLTLVPGSTGSVLENGSAQAFAANMAGENVYFSFNANQGDNLELMLDNISVPGSSYNGFQISVYSAAGTEIFGTTCETSNPGASCRLPLWNLAAGTYSVIAVPNDGGTINFTAQLQSDTLGGALTLGTPTTINLAQGQVQRFTFNANAGDTLALNLSNVTSTAPTGQPVYVSVYRPDVGTITTSEDYNNGNYYTQLGASSGSRLANLSNLPVSGTYTVVVFTPYGTPASAQLTLVPGSTGSVLENGTAQTFAANVAAENVYFSFNANQGDNLELTLYNITVPGSSSNGFQAYVYNAAGTEISYVYCATSDPGAACELPLWDLAAGTYSVIAIPNGGGSINFTAQLQSDTVEGALTPGVPATVNLAQGQTQRYTFTANAGENVVLSLSNVASTAPTGQPVYVNVYRPDTGAITTSNEYTQISTSSSQTINLPDLPASGTYTLVVYTTDSTPASGQLTFVPQ